MRRASRQLPVDPDTFDGEIVAKHATNGSDVNFLKQKFRQTFHAVMTPAKKMELMSVPGPSPDHWRIFLTVTLRSCPQLVHVELCRNEAIASTLEPFAALHGSLQHLDVSMSAGFGGTLQPLHGLRWSSGEDNSIHFLKKWFVAAGFVYSRWQSTATDGRHFFSCTAEVCHTTLVPVSARARHVISMVIHDVRLSVL